ncbi:hypothetical protein ZWY2020_028612 [Hordeum vulgare]|nr:hypothetical protein ZWY2020_028612 [Hordeum vulgare]
MALLTSETAPSPVPIITAEEPLPILSREAISGTLRELVQAVRGISLYLAGTQPPPSSVAPTTYGPSSLAWATPAFQPLHGGASPPPPPQLLLHYCHGTPRRCGGHHHARGCPTDRHHGASSAPHRQPPPSPPEHLRRPPVGPTSAVPSSPLPIPAWQPDHLRPIYTRHGTPAPLCRSSGPPARRPTARSLPTRHTRGHRHPRLPDTAGRHLLGSLS